MQIFISYKREDQAFAEIVHEKIALWGFKAWLDVVDIKAGEEWDTAIFRGMKSSQIVIGVLTRKSLASGNVLDEWGYALSTEKRLILLWLEDVDEADIPPRYIRIQRLDVRHNQELGFKRLQDALSSSAKVVPVEPELVEVEEVLEAQAVPVREIKPAQERIAHNVTNRSRMLDKVKAFWIDGVLEQSVHGAALIELGMEQSHESVNNPWNTVLQHTVYGDYMLPDETRISDVYNELHQELLILGDPGSGKTTTLLELARDTIAEAQADESLPIPVVFNLSSWADERKPLDKWLIDELNTKYQAPRKVANAWVETDSLLLLLDGLDEVDIRYRDLCVTAINDFRAEHGFTSMVVCSRIIDYEALSNRLNLNGAIVIQPLNEEQIDTYLGNLGENLSGVREAMALDPELRKIAETPLMLSIMTLAFHGLTVEDLPPLDSAEEQRRRLFETYTERMFARRENKWYSPQEAMHYLKWLAGRMVERKQSVFYIENLQIDWIAGDLPQRLFRIVGRTTFGLLMGLMVGALSGIAFLILYLMTGASLNTVSSNLSRDALIIALMFITIPAGFGGLIFGVAGIQAFAIDTMPDKLLPIKPLWKRFGQVYIACIIFSLIAVFLTLIVIALIGIIFDPSFVASSSVYRSSDLDDLQGWGAIAYYIFVFVAVYVFMGLIGGVATSLMALTFNIIKAQKRFIAYLIPLSILSAIKVLLLYGVGLGGIAVINGFMGYYDMQINGNDLAVIVLPVIPIIIFSALLIRIILRFLPSQHIVIPYVLDGSGLIAYPLFMGLTINITRAYTITPNAIFMGAIFLVIGGACGYLVGRISDQIRSAESLKWSWNWLWSGVGVIAMLIFAGLAGNQLFSDWTYYDAWTSPDKSNYYYYYANEEAALATEIYPKETSVAVLQSTLTYVEADQETNSAGIERRDEFDHLLHKKAELERTLFLMDAGGTYSNHEDYCGLIDNNSYKYHSYPYGESISTFLQEELTQVDKVIADLGVSSTAIKRAVSNLNREYWCNYELTQYKSRITYSRGRYTREGLENRLEGLIRLTLAIGFAFVITGGVAGGLHKNEVIEVRTQPNSGIRSTFYTALKVTVAFGFVGGAIGIVTGVLLGGIPQGEFRPEDVIDVIVPMSMIIGLTSGLALGFIMGGIDAVIKHVILRLFLMRSRSIPRNYSRLLDYLAERILLRKVGGGYIFIHRYLLEYFADIEKTSGKPLE